MFFEILVILVLTVINGALAMSELAVVSSRPARLNGLAEKGNKGAQVAIDLLANPGRFLSAVQIGITLVGILSGAVSGATLGQRAGAALAEAGMRTDVAYTLGVGLVVAAITYLSLVVGELVPKQIAMANPERIAARVAPTMRTIGRIARPLVWLLDGTSGLILKLIGIDPQAERNITDEEVHLTIAEATRAGVILPEERGMIAGVMRIADRNARAMMTPRREVETLDLNDPPEVTLEKARNARFSRMPVSDGAPDDIVGIVSLRELIGPAPPDLRAILKQPPVVLDTADAMSVVDKLRSSAARLALVYDEYGNFQGIITVMDLLETITGDFIDPDSDEPDIIRRADGSWLVAGSENADEFSGETGMPLPEGDFSTVAGMVLQIVGRIPRTGEVFVHDGWQIEVADMDGMRIDRLIVAAPPSTP